MKFKLELTPQKLIVKIEIHFEIIGIILKKWRFL
jgi:hypothetical protein